MTRTQLIKVADRISSNPKDSYPFVYDSVVKTGLYMRKPMFLLFDSKKALLAICYNHVCYFTFKLSPEQATICMYFYEDRNCDTKVFLYPYRYLFRDEQGVFDDKIEKAICHRTDYDRVIPIPF